MSIWIVESSVISTGAEAFENAVRSAGSECRWLSIDDEIRGRYGRWEDDEAVVFRGSFEAAESFRQKRPNAAPGVIGTYESLRCSSYYPAVGARLLNADHEFLPLGDLRSRWAELKARFGEGLFVRPDSGAKAFTGQLVSDLDDFEKRERPYLTAMDPSDLIIVAGSKDIAAEWRMAVVNGSVVTGSQYKIGGKKIVSPDVPSEVHAFAQAAASEIDPPAPAYMLDVAQETSGRLSVVELNSFSCSDIYACDPTALVAAVEEWLATTG